MSACTLTLNAQVDVRTSRDGDRYRAEVAPGHVSVADTELDAATSVAMKALHQLTGIRRVVSCDHTRSRQGLFSANCQIVKPL